MKWLEKMRAAAARHTQYNRGEAMKRMTAAILGIALLSGAALAQTTTSNRDQVNVEQAIENWNRAWQTKDAKLAAQDYSNDADWTNAFGMQRKGRAEIEKILAEVFSLPFVMEGQSKTAEQTVRFIKPDVALVVTRVERAGQRTPSGADLGIRQTSHLRVLMKSEGSWKIVSHLISDARDPVRREH